MTPSIGVWCGSNNEVGYVVMISERHDEPEDYNRLFHDLIGNEIRAFVPARFIRPEVRKLEMITTGRSGIAEPRLSKVTATPMAS